MPFAHGHRCRVAALCGDPAALGGAVTTALCGSWDHEDPCRWPHHTSSMAVPGEPPADVNGSPRPGVAYVEVTVSFDAPDDEVAEVRHRIREALATGSLLGPDGQVTTWTVAQPT